MACLGDSEAAAAATAAHLSSRVDSTSLDGGDLPLRPKDNFHMGEYRPHSEIHQVTSKSLQNHKA